MSSVLSNLLKISIFNGWKLFWLLSIPISLLIFNQMLNHDLATGQGLGYMISYAVRWAIPFIFLVVAASSFHVLFPGSLSKWWLRNRKYLGMCFAVAMAWQAVFIFMLSTFLRDYYFKEVYFLRDEIEGSVGYIFLVAMVITSFQFGRKFVDRKQWKLIHKGGVYFLWAYAFSVYWWNLFYYPTLVPFTEPRIIDYVFYWSGFAAFGLRISAWGKQRMQLKNKNSVESKTPIYLKLLGGAFIVLGLFASATGLYWQRPVSTFLTSPQWSAQIELWLPYWPFEPYYSLLMIALGALLITKRK